MITSSTHVVFGAGVLGQEIARQLAAGGARVRLANRAGKTSIPNVEAVAADLTDPSSAEAAGKGADVIYFCAAPPYQDWTRSFMALQEGAIVLARRTGAVLVAAENLYGYGKAGDLTETLSLGATTRKGDVRARMSHRLFEAHAGREINAVAGRASDFFGPGVRLSALGSRFWPELLKGKPVNWFGDPDKLHTFTYLPDFAAALITLGSTSDSWGRAWHVPSPDTLSVRALAAQAARIAGVPEPRLRRTPKMILQLIGFAIPAAGEMVEMEYAFARDFVMRQDDWNANFKLRATSWNDALSATIADWRSLAAADLMA